MMDLKSVILGFLDWKRLTGYELKGMFAEYDFLPWSGNNNQIYTALVELEREGRVVKETMLQEKLPAQKRYVATEEGRQALRQAVLQPAEPPRGSHDFLLHLAWAECLTDEELTTLLDAYQLQTEMDLAICREKARRADGGECRSQREQYLWEMILRHTTEHLQCELNWLARLRNGLANREAKHD